MEEKIQLLIIWAKPRYVSQMNTIYEPVIISDSHVKE